MRLSLSSATAPDAALADLFAACVRRGLTGLELVEGHGHGVSTDVEASRAEAVHAAAREVGIRICALYREGLERAELERTARMVAALGAPLVVAAAGVDRQILPEAFIAFRAAGAHLLLAHGSEPAAVELLRRFLATLPDTETVGLAWEVRPKRDDHELVGGVLRAAGPHLRYVRLHGGGPEAAEQTGMGVGALMARLALARYARPLILTPSDPRYHYIWRSWLGRAGGWGCGSKQSDPSLVTLEQETLTSGGDA